MLKVILSILLVSYVFASAPAWDGTEAGKNKYTRTFYNKFQGVIEQFAQKTFKTPLPEVHPMYQTIMWVRYVLEDQSSSVEKWLVPHLLNTAGHWGWSQDKKANRRESSVYYEVALGTILDVPHRIPSKTGELPFLQEIRREAKQLRAIKNDTLWTNYMRYRFLYHDWDDGRYFGKGRDLLWGYYNESIVASLTKQGLLLDAKPVDPKTCQTIEFTQIDAAQKLVKATSEKCDSFSITKAFLFPQEWKNKAILRALPAAPQTATTTQQPASQKQEEWTFTAADGAVLKRSRAGVTYTKGSAVFSSGKGLNMQGMNLNGVIVNVKANTDSSPEEMYRDFLTTAGKIVDVQPPSLRYLMGK